MPKKIIDSSEEEWAEGADLDEEEDDAVKLKRGGRSLPPPSHIHMESILRRFTRTPQQEQLHAVMQVNKTKDHDQYLTAPISPDDKLDALLMYLVAAFVIYKNRESAQELVYRTQDAKRCVERANFYLSAAGYNTIKMTQDTVTFVSWNGTIRSLRFIQEEAEKEYYWEHSIEEIQAEMPPLEDGLEAYLLKYEDEMDFTW